MKELGVTGILDGLEMGADPLPPHAFCLAFDIFLLAGFLDLSLLSCFLSFLLSLLPL